MESRLGFPKSLELHNLIDVRYSPSRTAGVRMVAKPVHPPELVDGKVLAMKPVRPPANRWLSSPGGCAKTVSVVIQKYEENQAVSG